MNRYPVPVTIVLAVVLLCAALASGSPAASMAQKLRMAGYRADEVSAILSGQRTPAQIDSGIRRTMLGLAPAPPVTRHPPAEAGRGRSVLKAATPYLSAIKTSARRHGVPPSLILAVIQVESAFSATAVSHRGAVGLMQLMPATAGALGIGNRFDPWENIAGGTRYLSHCLARFNTTALALAAYNAGPECVLAHGGIPPYKETRRFVQRVLDYERYFRQHLGPA